MNKILFKQKTHTPSIACKQQACWWAHYHSLYLYFVLNKFLFKPTVKANFVTSCAFEHETESTHFHSRKFVTHIENVRRRFTKRITGINNLEREQRLTVLKLPSLEYRTVRGNMMETCKIYAWFLWSWNCAVPCSSRMNLLEQEGTLLNYTKRQLLLIVCRSFLLTE